MHVACIGYGWFSTTLHYVNRMLLMSLHITKSILLISPHHSLEVFTVYSVSQVYEYGYCPL